MTKTVGEHWVAAMLARRGWAPALTRDGVERTDILAVGAHLPWRPLVEVQVKTATHNGTATTWLLGSKAQQPSRSRHEWFVLVLLPPVPGELLAFVVPRDVVAATAWMVHRYWLSDPDAPAGSRNTPVERARVGWQVLEEYQDRWDLLEVPTDQVPVLLHPHWRDRAQLERVGLPPGHPWREQLPVW